MQRPPSAVRPGTRNGVNPLQTLGPNNTLGSMGPSGNPPTTASMRPPSARPGSAARIGTANRPGTGTRPGTGRVGTPGGSRLASHVGKRNVITQGVGSITPATGGPGRQVADRNFYVSELRLRITELNTEIEKMTNEIDQFEKDNQASLSLEKKIESLRGEITVLQGSLSDYNFILEKVHTSLSDLDEEGLKKQAEDLRGQNEMERQKGDQIFTERNSKEKLIQETEAQIQEIQAETERQLSQLNPEQLDHYRSLRTQNQSLINELNSSQNQLNSLTAESLKLEEELNSDLAKQKAMALNEELASLLKQKADLDEELGSNLSIPEEIERLTQKVKGLNGEISSIEQQTTETLDSINKIREDISRVEKQLSEGKSDRAEKFRELVRKDKEMSAFIEKYEGSKNESNESNSKLQGQVVTNLDTISKYLARKHNLPSLETYKEMQEALHYKETQLNYSQATASRLQEEFEARQGELQKMSTLDSRLAEEANQIKEKMAKMQEDLERFSQLEKIKGQYENDKQRLINERQAFMRRKELLSQQNQLLSMETDSKEKQLRENEMHTQLEVLEKSLRHYESSNFSMKEYIAAKGKEGDYKTTAAECNNLVNDLNNLCVQWISAHTQI